MHSMKRLYYVMLAYLLIITLLLPSQAFILPAHAASELNYALNKPVKGKSSDASVGRATAALDGDASTYWQPLSADRGDDLNVWMTVDLTAGQKFDKTVLNFTGTQGIVSGYKIMYSDNNSTWTVAYARDLSTGAIQAQETAGFTEVTARYVKVSVDLKSNNLFKLAEFEVIGGGDPNARPDLKRAYLTDASGNEYPSGTTIKLRKNEITALQLHGQLVTGAEADMSDPGLAASLTSSNPADASVDSSGTVTALQSGVAQITGEIRQGSITVTTSIWIDVSDPEQLLADIQLTHPTMAVQIGQPAFVKPGDVYPVVEINPYVEAVLDGEVVDSVQNVVYRLPQLSLTPGVMQQLQIPGAVAAIGEHQIRLTLTPAGKAPLYDTFYFFSADDNTIPAGQSRLAFIGSNGKLTYVPDYKGNRLIDYSNAGYMGGGVQLPDVPVRATLKPNPDGDDTARIQAAIDAVSDLPLSPDGFRGAVLLSKGTYRVGSTLKISTGGVVLRGEGQGTDGTILFATGKEHRNILEIGGDSGPVLSTTKQTTIADLYVPVGSRSFRVDDASQFSVGDTVMVRRKGNDRWIHEIQMDQITDRPGTTDSTQQWTPFDMNFDRVITKIEGNVVTVDAPLANSFERQWGGGELLAYDDSGRIQQVGVENMRVDVNFNPSIVGVDSGIQYYADEAHPDTFISLKSVKNAWVRDITALHLGYSMVYTGRDTKWTTTQDSTVLEMASTLDGGRRYPLLYEGQLGLTQRVNVDTARHAYIVGSRVPGPNVFLDGTATTQFNTSEPHHRWSVGGLFDNIDANIAIQDRGWLGSGHGWAGANWLAWNTKGGLVLQKPPTAQNYAVGFTGKVNKPYLPNSDDTRPRENGYWDSLGTSVYPRSIYLQQLGDRRGSGAVSNIGKKVYGEPKLSSLTVSSGQLSPAFTAEQTEYSVGVTYDVYKLTVTPTGVDTGAKVWVNGAEAPSGQASQELGLSYGDNTVQIAVYSPSGNTSKNYKITVNRAQPKLTSIAFGSKFLFVKSSESVQGDVQGIYEDGSTKALTAGVVYQSANPDVAQVDSGGVVTGIRPGIAGISAQYGGQQTEARAIVSGRPVQFVGIETDSKQYSMGSGDMHPTVVYAVYSDRSKMQVSFGVTYQSSNPAVIQVDNNGIVKAIGPGKADLIVLYNGEQEKVKVTVITDSRRPPGKEEN